MKTEILQFMLARGAGDNALRKLLAWSRLNGEAAVPELCRTPGELTRIGRLNAETAERIVSARDSALALHQRLEQHNIDILWMGRPAYPERLCPILNNDAPPILFVKGNPKLLERNAVGFCGSRKASPKGLEITIRCVEKLVEKKFAVVGGYAQGVDITAHRAAVENNGDTIIVLAEGILKFHEKTEVKGFLTPQNYLAVSQFPPDCPWFAHNAMKRNGTIIGLSDALIIVESGKSGGTFASGEEALKRNHPLFVINYQTPEFTAESNAYFIQKGGAPIGKDKKQGLPNLSRLFDVAGQQRWRNRRCSQPGLFG